MSVSPELAAALGALVDAALAAHEPGLYPPRAFATERALLAYTTEALFAYYVGVDGTVYELDMDRFLPQLDPVVTPDVVRSARAALAAAHPELAALDPRYNAGSCP